MNIAVCPSPGDAVCGTFVRVVSTIEVMIRLVIMLLSTTAMSRHRTERLRGFEMD